MSPCFRLSVLKVPYLHLSITLHGALSFNRTLAPIFKSAAARNTSFALRPADSRSETEKPDLKQSATLSSFRIVPSSWSNAKKCAKPFRCRETSSKRGETRDELEVGFFPAFQAEELVAHCNNADSEARGHSLHLEMFAFAATQCEMRHTAARRNSSGSSSSSSSTCTAGWRRG
jgi:hypothetical protein